MRHLHRPTQALLALLLTALIWLPSASPRVHVIHAAGVSHPARSEYQGDDKCPAGTAGQPYLPVNRGQTNRAVYYSLAGGRIGLDNGLHEGPTPRPYQYYTCSEYLNVYGLEYATAETWCGPGSHIVSWHFFYTHALLNVDGPAFRGVHSNRMWATVHNWAAFDFATGYFRIVLLCESD